MDHIPKVGMATDAADLKSKKKRKKRTFLVVICDGSSRFHQRTRNIALAGRPEEVSVSFTHLASSSWLSLNTVMGGSFAVQMNDESAPSRSTREEQEQMFSDCGENVFVLTADGAGERGWWSLE